MKGSMAVNLDFPIEFLTGAIDKAQGDTRVWLERFRAELDFA